MKQRYRLIDSTVINEEAETVDMNTQVGNFIQAILMKTRPDLDITSLILNRYSAQCRLVVDGKGIADGGVLSFNGVTIQRTADIRKENAYYRTSQLFVNSICSMELGTDERTWDDHKKCALTGGKCLPQASLQNNKGDDLEKLTAAATRNAKKTS